MSKVLLVGQAPSRSSDPMLPLSGRTGATLAGWCGLSEGEFRCRFWLANAWYEWLGAAPGGGDAVPRGRTAREHLWRLMRAQPAGTSVVLLGAATRRLVLGPWTLPPYEWRDLTIGAPFEHDRVLRLAWAPHPSGVSRHWNHPKNVARAKRFFRALAKETL